MTSKFSLISVVVGAALLLAVPAAWGKGQLQPVVTPEAMHEDGFDTAVAAQQAIWMAEDGFDRAVAAKLALQSPVVRRSDSVDGATFGRTHVPSTQAGAARRYSDSAESALVAGTRPGAGSVTIRYSDSADGAMVGSRLEAPVVSATSSGTEIEWPQVGVGLGIGILLALGLGLIMRVAHVRPFAH